MAYNYQQYSDYRQGPRVWTRPHNSIPLAADYGLIKMHVVMVYCFNGLRYPKLLGLRFLLYKSKQRMYCMSQ